MVMAQKIESQEDAVFTQHLPNNRRYIYFEKPPELWMGTTSFENHEEILLASGRNRDHIHAIGFADQLTDKQEVSFDRHGSSNLQIPGGDAEACAQFARSLPSGRRRIRFTVSSSTF